MNKSSMIRDRLSLKNVPFRVQLMAILRSGLEATNQCIDKENNQASQWDTGLSMHDLHNYLSSSVYKTAMI